MPENSGGVSPLIEKTIKVSYHSNDRMTFFSDGVFVITITLLVLEIKIPEIAENLVATDCQGTTHLIPL